MPQMMPISWTMIMLFTLMINISIMTMIYFTKSKYNLPKNTYLYNTPTKKMWKWTY